MDSEIKIGDFVMAVRTVINPSVPSRTADIIIYNIYSVRNIHTCKCGTIYLDVGLHNPDGIGILCLRPYHDNEDWPTGFSIDRSSNRLSFKDEDFQNLSLNDRLKLSNIIESIKLSNGKVVFAAGYDFIKIDLIEHLRTRKINLIVNENI